jgi:hypothetical protein
MIASLLHTCRFHGAYARRAVWASYRTGNEHGRPNLPRHLRAIAHRN